MRLIVAPSVAPRRLGLLAGSFNPPTRAHVALAEAALGAVDHVLFVLPSVLPHKAWEGATAEQRLEMLRQLTAPHRALGAGMAEGGLYIDIVREARELFPGTELYVVCGRDAAERIVGWDYGEPDAVRRYLEEFRLLVAPRNGKYEPPADVAHAVETLQMDSYDDCASSVVRDRVEGWRDLVPDQIRDLVDIWYRR